MLLDCDTFVKSILTAMWMLNDLPRSMREELNSQLGVIWLLISDPKCFPSLTFTPEQQQCVCEALSAYDDKYTYQTLLQTENLKVKKMEEAETPDDTLIPPTTG